MNFFESWVRLGTTLGSAMIFFVLIVVLVRLLGKRTTANLNNFDWIIMVCIGSLASSGILLKNVPLIDAIGAIVVLGGMQWLSTWAMTRWEWFEKIVRARPRLLTHKGEWLDDALRHERITRDEVRTALRSNKMFGVSEANWVILETNGKLTVIPRADVDASNVDVLADISRDLENLRSRD